MKTNHPTIQTSKLPLECPAGGSRPKICNNLRHLWFLALLLLAASACFVVDATDWALPLEAWLAECMASATRCVFVGLNADPALLGTVAPACAGLRTATAGAILGACLTARRKWLGALVGALCGLGLNFVRLIAVEAALRVDHAAGMMLHDLALYAVVLPAALLAWALWRLCSRPAKITLAASALSLAALLLAIDVPDPKEALCASGERRTERAGAKRQTFHGHGEQNALTGDGYGRMVDLTGFYLDLTRRPCRGATIHDSRFTIHANDCKE